MFLIKYFLILFYFQLISAKISTKKTKQVSEHPYAEFVAKWNQRNLNNPNFCSFNPITCALPKMYHPFKALVSKMFYFAFFLNRYLEINIKCK